MVSGLALGALVARFSFPWEAAAAAASSVSYGGAMYRAGGNGKILVSANGGASWKLHTDLGDAYSVSSLAVDRANKLRATVGYAGRSFQLVLAPDAKRWLTS